MLALMLNYLPLSLWKQKSFYQSYLQSYKTHCNNHHHLHLILQYSENSVSSLYSIWVNLNCPDNNFIYKICFLLFWSTLFSHLKVPYMLRESIAKWQWYFCYFYISMGFSFRYDFKCHFNSFGHYCNLVLPNCRCDNWNRN